MLDKHEIVIYAYVYVTSNSQLHYSNFQDSKYILTWNPTVCFELSKTLSVLNTDPMWMQHLLRSWVRFSPIKTLTWREVCRRYTGGCSQHNTYEEIKESNRRDAIIEFSPQLQWMHQTWQALKPRWSFRGQLSLVKARELGSSFHFLRGLNVDWWGPHCELSVGNPNGSWETHALVLK